MVLLKNVNTRELSQRLKKYVSIIAILMLVSSMSACSGHNNAVEKDIVPPKISKHFILQPSFETAMGTFSAGTAFALTMEGQKVILVLTAHHIFGTAGGLKKQIKSEELPNFIKLASFDDVFDGSRVTTSTEVVIIPGAEPCGKYVNKDLAAFKITPNKNISTAKLCTTKPTIGQTVWLAASVIEGAPKDQKLHEAIVTLSNDKELDFKYSNSKINLKFTSGAPILNSKGEVVGINLGGIHENGKLIGVANPSISIKKLLDSALKK